jgi:hypothetical protein
MVERFEVRPAVVKGVSLGYTLTAITSYVSQDKRMRHQELGKPRNRKVKGPDSRYSLNRSDGFIQTSKAMPSGCKRDVLTTAPAAAPAEATPTAAASAGLARLKAVLAVHGTVSPRLERHCGLLSASGTDHRCTP